MIKTLIFAAMVTANLFVIIMLLLNAWEAWQPRYEYGTRWWSLVYLLCAVSVFGMMVVR